MHAPKQPAQRISLLIAATVTLLHVGVDLPHAVADDEVTVADGDTLSVIALMWYGDAGYAQAIAWYNRLSDPDSLAVGQVLKLPETPSAPTAILGASAGSQGIRSQQGAASEGGPRAPATGPVLQMGLATWYGPGFEGQITKCGQVFHSADLTASSNDLPCGTLIDVTDVQNGKNVLVTVDDTGNFTHPQILDLSPAAFSALASPDTGVLRVSVSLVSS
jgi:hypothetical protein